MLLPESILHSSLFAVLAAFASVNTVIYGVLAIGKLLPKVYLADWLSKTNQRSESRSIYPDPNLWPSGRVNQLKASTDDGTTPELISPHPLN